MESADFFCVKGAIMFKIIARISYCPANKLIGAVIISLVLIVTATAQDISPTGLKYQMPPKEIVELIDVPQTPAVSAGPNMEWIAVLERPSHPSIDEFVQPELRLAGLRINPRTNAPGRSSYYTDIKLKKISNLDEKNISGLPDDARIRNFSWSPDGARLAFTHTTADGVELWVADVNSAKAERLGQFYLNGAHGNPYRWFPDSRNIICRTIPADRGPAPEEPTVPTGPIILENEGEIAPAVTYTDLLKNSYDEELFEYYLQAQLMLVSHEGTTRKIGSQAMIIRAEPSPDGNYILAEIIHRPFSYLVPIYRFPRSVEIWDTEGKIIRVVYDQPLAENIPTVSGAVRTGPREFNWRSDAGAVLYYAEALDGGDPRREAAARDQIYTMKAPFKGDPIPLFALELRYDDVIWNSDDLALISEWWWQTRRIRTWAFAPGSASVEPELILDYSWEDRYKHPGSPVTRDNEAGHRVLLLDKSGKSMFLTGRGGSPEGDRPFLDKYDLMTKKTERLWRSEAPYYESIYKIIDPDRPEVLTMRESITEPPNVFYRDLKKDKLYQVTAFPNPTPQMEKVQKEQINYNRDDGLNLTGTLYLPAGYSPEDGPLPTLIWAYPREFKSADAAGQVTNSPYRFIRVGWWSPAIWVVRGYAVLDKAGMPVIGEGDVEPNDSFVEQLKSDAAAAIDELVRRGITDPERVAVGGHSYGAFMTANLLAHSDLFRAGLARSGAYNRTLTPFGFQSEDRTLWEAPDVYFAMSPFMHVENIDEPLLLIHGEADNNIGTYPMQSKRFYNALKGMGATVRLVMLPFESHSYRARESIMHVLWETDRWLEKYVKNAPPRKTETAKSEDE